jgi:hypothetical protein
MGGATGRIRAALAIVLATALSAAPAGAINLAPLLDAPGSTVTLSGTASYTIDEHALSVSKTIQCNNARIVSTGGPIRVSGAGVRLTIDHCRIQGSGWSLLGALAGAELVVQNDTQLTGDGDNTAIYVREGTLDVTGGTIADARWGVQMEASTAALHGVTATDVVFVVQNVAGAVTLDGGCTFTNLDPVNSGAAVSVIASATYPTRGASAVVRGGTYTGFGNAIDVQPTAAAGLPSGTVEVTDATFQGAVFSALAAVDATNVHVARTRVLDAKTDGIFLVNSTGTIEDTQVVGSLNSGVTFYGCPNGATLRNSLVHRSAHQGVAIGVDPASGRGSHGIRVLDNTLTENALANLCIDDQSDAVMHGNIFAGAPDRSIRWHGAQSATLVGGLLLDSYGGLEAKDGAQGRAALSVFARHARSGALAYANATLAVSHSVFDANGDDATTPDYALVADTGAHVSVGWSAFGPPGSRGYYNKAGVASDATHVFWGAASGPQLPSGAPNGGAVVGAAGGNGSSVAVDPFLATPPVDARIDDAFALDPDATTTWTSELGTTLSLTGAPGIAPASGLVAVLRALDTISLGTPAPPVGTATDGVVVVWAAYDLLARSAAGSLRIRAATESGLSRLDGDGQWVPVAATWDAAASELVYAPADVRALQGTFAFGNGLGCATARECLRAIDPGSLCDGMNPKLSKRIAAKLRAAGAKLTKAAGSAKPKKVPKLIAQARKLLHAIDTLAGKFASAKVAPISGTCRAAIGDAMRPALQRLDAGTP